MSSLAGSFAWHLEQLGDHGCCALVQDDGHVVECGLLCGHDCDHQPWTPGEYLTLTPLLDPLGWLRFTWAHWLWRPCPVCSCRTDGVPVRSAAGLHVWHFGPDLVVERSGRSWKFWPCGCEAFEVAA